MHLKKLKLLPKSKSKKETVRNIEEKWDFADDWLKKEVAKFNIKPEEALLVTIDGKEQLFCQAKELKK